MSVHVDKGLDVPINELMSSSQRVHDERTCCTAALLETVEGRGEKEKEREREGGGGQRKREGERAVIGVGQY